MDELIERALRGEASETELQRLAEWRRASADNERTYRQLERLIDAAREMGSPSHARPRPTARMIIDRAAGAERTPNGWRRWAPWSVAAAAVLTAGVVVWGRPSLGHADVVTGATELATVELADGSVVRLAPSSRLRFSGRNARTVELTGRAFFAVARRVGRPFVVRTRFGAAQALGTRFEITTRADDLHLVVVEGRVALSGAANRVEVSAGQTSDVDRGSASAPVAVASSDSAVRWTGNFLAFQATPLHVAVREVERVHGIHVRVADSVLARQTVTATFTDQNATQVMAVLCSIVNARCVTDPTEIVMRP